ncbi:acetyl-CoA synthetase-like protein [Polychaeton citri CBS 116435]|uniref:Acetyl-CoA synthetase-like protein n=1 Tax=Polychaeton citri CBS 116435 TaxID=1314669 RepID=A0A9P4Q8Q6_9PEZI|nr:acetyl-CoA synthetase-like protein [Polychaeton citri CBS 116435]
MPSGSLYPDQDIPNVGIWDFLFARKDRGFPDEKPIFVDAVTGRGYSWASTKSAAEAFGKGLRAVWEWEKHDVLTLFTPNSVDTPVIIWGVHFAGGIVSPANPGYTVDELAFQLKDSGSKGIATQKAQLPIAVEACNRVGIPLDRICLIGDERDDQVKHFTSVRNLSGAARYRRAKVDPAKDLAFIVYSSGTTGHPKGVMLSHRNIIANVLQTKAVEPELSAKPRPEAPEGDIILAFLPFFHIYGLTVILHLAMYIGYRSLVMSKFDIESWCQLAQTQKVTFAYIVPPVALQLAKAPLVEKYDLSSIRMLHSGAAPLTKELVETLYERLGLKIKQGYGLSETSPTTHMQPWPLWHSTVGAVGHLLPNQTAKYMSPEDKEVAAGEPGELWVKGPNIFQGYLNNPEGTRNALTSDGYFKTGDVGYQDKDGNFYITDRVKELIKYKGFQVPPAELEGLLTAHEKIDDVAVLGIYKDDIASEVPMACVVPKKGEHASRELEKEIVDWLSAKVSSHKRLRGGVKFVDEIPKSVSGKILRRMLKAKHLEEQQAAPKAKL